jgi:Rrf2 family protein
MPINSRFAVAVHILALLAASDGMAVTSERLAASASTNPVVIRRILCMLARAGLTKARVGAGGGSVLARQPSEVTLADVYAAVEQGSLFAMHHEAPSSECPIGRNLQAALGETTRAAEHVLQGVLAGRTIGDVLEQVRSGDRAEHAVSGLT